VLQGRSAQQIADALADPASPVASAIGGTANAITADLCRITGNQPASACTPGTASESPSPMATP
jgi:hypothetical protein